MPPKKTVKRGGSVASDAVMSYVPDNAFYVVSNKNFFEGGARLRASGRRGGKRGGAPTNTPVVGRAEIPSVGFPGFPEANDRFDLSMVPQNQHLLAAQPFHTMNAIERGVVYPNMPKSVNPIAFGGGSRGRKRTNNTSTKSKTAKK